MPQEDQATGEEDKDKTTTAGNTGDGAATGDSSTSGDGGGQAGDGDKGADSSTAKGVKEPQNVLEAVEQALAGTKAADGKTSDGKGSEGSPRSESGQSKSDGGDDDRNRDGKQGKKGDEDTRFSDEEWAALSGKTKKAIRRFREREREFEERVGALDEDASAIHVLRKSLTDSGITQREFSAALTVLRLTRDDPAKALEVMRGMVQELEAEVGDVLPADLKSKVDAGTIDDETARELSRKRKEAERATRRATSEATLRLDDQRAREDEERHQENSRQVSASVKAHLDKWQRTDPDYPKLEPVVRKRVALELRALAAEGKVLTSKTAVEHLQKVIDDVREEVTGLLPVKDPKNPVRGGASSANRPEPKSMVEAAEQALAAAK